MVYQLILSLSVVTIVIIFYEIKIKKMRSHSEQVKRKQSSRDREFFENVLDAVPDPIFVKNEKHQWIYGNKKFSKILKMDENDYLGKSDYDVFPKEMADIFWRKDSETLERLIVTENEENIIEDDEVKDVLTKKTPFITSKGEVLLIGVIRDITLRKQQANIIENLYRLIESSSDLYCIFDLNGGPQYFNSHALEMGFSSNIKHYSDIFDPSFPLDDLESSIENRNQWEGEAVLNNFITNTQHYYWVRIFKVKNEAGKLISISIVATNLQHRKEVEARLVYNSKMISLGEMAGGIAHEINSPLAIISGYSGQIKKMIERKSWDQEKALWYSNKIQDTVFRISKIIKGLRSFSGSSENEALTNVELEPLIKEVIEFSQDKIDRKKIALHLDVSKGIRIDCRPIQIQQVLLNLLNNSIDAVKCEDDPWIKIVAEEINNKVTITVIDSGPGIDESIKPKLMTPFFTTKDVGEGVGLGLPISKGLMENNNGQLVYLDDFPNTAFRIIFN